MSLINLHTFLLIHLLTNAVVYKWSKVRWRPQQVDYLSTELKDVSVVFRHMQTHSEN